MRPRKKENHTFMLQQIQPLYSELNSLSFSTLDTAIKNKNKNRKRRTYSKDIRSSLSVVAGTEEEMANHSKTVFLCQATLIANLMTSRFQRRQLESCSSLYHIDSSNRESEETESCSFLVENFTNNSLLPPLSFRNRTTF